MEGTLETKEREREKKEDWTSYYMNVNRLTPSKWQTIENVFGQINFICVCHELSYLFVCAALLWSKGVFMFI